MVGAREVMFNGGLATGTAAVVSVGVWSGFLLYKLSFGVVSVFPLASELLTKCPSVVLSDPLRHANHHYFA